MPGALKKFEDRQILSRLKRKDSEAFIKVYDENVAEINRFVYFKIGSREEANDLTSIIFLKAWNHIQNKSLVEAKTLRALLYKIARNAIIDYYRENSGRKSTSLDNEENKIEVVDEDSHLEKVHDRLDQENELERIKSKLPLLKEEYREVIIMKFISDLSLEEIADITKKSRGNVRVLLYRSLKALKELLEL